MKLLLCLFTKPEYIALLISIIAMSVNVYIANKNRKHTFAKEEYFKLQQMVEKIIAKLLLLNNHQAKLKIFFELSFRAEQDRNISFIDVNDTLSKDEFEKNGEEISAIIDIYFNSLSAEWNDCLEKFSKLLTIVYVISQKIEKNIFVDWKKEAGEFNRVTLELDNKPECIAFKLKEKLVEFKKKNL